MDAENALLLPLARSVDAANRGWVQLARSTGGVVSNGGKKFEITPEDVEAYASSIRANPDRVSIDYDHSFGKSGSSRAAGWVDASTAIVRPGADSGSELWAMVDWTPAAADAIRAGEFRFISPEITFESTEDGVLRKAAKFLAAALTNRPFLTMAPVALVRLENDNPEEGAMTPDDQLAALNTRAGEILLEQRVVAATTPQLLNAIKCAEHELGYSYDEIRARQRGAPDPVDPESARVAALADEHVESLKLGRPVTQDEYLAAVKAVSS